MPSPTEPASGKQAHSKADLWLGHLREMGMLAERMRFSRQRLSDLGPNDLAGDIGGEIMDACAARVGSLIYRVDEMIHRSLATSGRTPEARWAVRWKVESTMDEGDTDGYIASTTNGRIHLPPSTLPPERLPAARGALLRVSGTMLRACEAIEAYASDEEAEPGPAPSPGL